MITRVLQRFFLLLLCAATALAAPLQSGSVARLSFHDVDGNMLSTADGHVTIISVVTRESEDAAQAIPDQVPDRYVGNPRFRYVTVVNFQKKIAAPFQGLTRLIIRQRLESEAAKLRPEYQQKKITHDPRRDMFVVADFDGSATTELGLAPESNEVRVFVFDGRGRLIQQWKGVPPAGALPKAIATAEQS